MTATRRPLFDRPDVIVLGACLGGIVLAALTHFVKLGSVTAFVCSAIAVAALAALVGRSVDQIGERLGPGATGVLQSALGNLPELFIAIFALRAGLVEVVRAALIGSILGNLLFVLGLAFVVGGLKNGPQRFDVGRAKVNAALMVLAVAALVVPSLASYSRTSAGHHEHALSVVVSVAMLVVFALSVPSSIARTPGNDAPAAEPARWPMALAIGLLSAASVSAAVVSDWFVSALEPAIKALHISALFAGLVIVALAGNAIENVVGIQLAAKNKAEAAMSVVINSPVQISLVLAPALVLLSPILGGSTLTLVFSPMLLIAVVLAVFVAVLITIDGESTWLEGVALLALYGIIAASFWWG
jgi:Ca2+:H+ antiporter